MNEPRVYRAHPKKLRPCQIVERECWGISIGWTETHGLPEVDDLVTAKVTTRAGKQWTADYLIVHSNFIGGYAYGAPPEECYTARRYHEHGEHVYTPGEDDNPYVTLGIEPDASQAEIKRAWKTQMRKHHPDAIDVDAVIAAAKRDAHNRSVKINAAYQQIRSQ